MDWVEWILRYWVDVLFGQICAGLAAGWKYLHSKIKKHTAEDVAMKDATQALLDNSMGRLFQECKNKGYTTREEARRYERMYVAYYGLDGNGAVTNEHNHFQKLDIRDD